MAPRSEYRLCNGNGAEVVALNAGDGYRGWHQAPRLGKAVGHGEWKWYSSLVEVLERGADA